MATATKSSAKNTAAKAETAAPTAAPTTDATAGLGFSLNVTRASVDKIERKPVSKVKEPNPTEEAVKHSKDTGDVLAFNGLPDAEAVKKVTGLLRRAASDADHGIQIQTVQDGDGTWTINFRATDKKRDRKYTADDIRKWAKDNGHGDLSGMKIPNEVRDAFKAAKGFGKKSKAAAK